MPIVTEDVRAGYGSCTDSLCPGYDQQPADVVRRETSFSFVELGGDLPGVERSVISERFAHDRDSVCSICGAHRVASIELRPDYPNASGQDPLRLRRMTRDQKIIDMEMEDIRKTRELEQMRAQLAAAQQLGTARTTDQELAEMRAIMEHQNAQMAEMQAQLAERSTTRSRAKPKPEANGS